MALALTYGSFGDLLETAKLAVKAVKLLRDGASGKLSQERLALATELQTLNSDLITLDFIASAAHLDPSCTRSLLVAIRIRAEAEACRRVLKRFLDKLQAPRGLLGTIIGALSEESELAKFKTEISRPLKAIRTLTTMLNLATSQGLAVQLEDQRRQIGERFDHFGDRLTAYHEAVLNLPVARGVSDDIFCVVDPVGGNIPISLRYCHVYTDLDRIINAYLHNNPEAGSQYVQCGDYHIVSSEGSIITPMEFTQAVRAGTRVEMSIIKRQLHNWRDRQTQNTRCPYCYRNNANQTLNDWFKCANPTCGRKYKINVHDRETEHESGEMEQIMSPQVASGTDLDSFRLVQIYTEPLKSGSYVTQLSNYLQSQKASHLMRWSGSSAPPGPSNEIKWTVQCKVSGMVTGVANSKAAARDEAARQALVALCPDAYRERD